MHCKVFTGGEQDVATVEKERKRKYYGGEVTGDTRCVAAVENKEQDPKEERGKEKGKTYRGIRCR